MVVILTPDMDRWALKQEVHLARNMKLELLLLVPDGEDAAAIRRYLRENKSGLEILIGGIDMDSTKEVQEKVVRAHTKKMMMN